MRFRPKRFARPLKPYDLNKEYRENKKKQDAGKFSIYTYFIVKEFNDRYYPEVEFSWHTAGNVFHHVGVREERDTVRTVFLRWGRLILNDVQTWGFDHGELERTTRADRFAIIPKAEVTAAIKKSLLDRKLIGGEKDVTDVFRYRAQKFETDSKDIGIKFPEVEFGPVRYGVSVGEEVYLFTETGQPTK